MKKSELEKNNERDRQEIAKTIIKKILSRLNGNGGHLRIINNVDRRANDRWLKLSIVMPINGTEHNVKLTRFVWNGLFTDDNYSFSFDDIIVDLKISNGPTRKRIDGIMEITVNRLRENDANTEKEKLESLKKTILTDK